MTYTMNVSYGFIGGGVEDLPCGLRDGLRARLSRSSIATSSLPIIFRIPLSQFVDGRAWLDDIAARNEAATLSGSVSNNDKLNPQDAILAIRSSIVA